VNKTGGIGRAVSCRFSGVWRIARHTWNDVIENEIFTRASAIAFGAMMAAVPFLALVITLGALLMPVAGVESKELLHALESLLGTVFPDDAHRVIEEQIARLHGGQPIAVLSISLAVTIWLASGLYAAVIDGLNRIYGVRDTRPYWKFRLTAIWMTVVQSVILLAAVTAIFAFPYLVQWVGVKLLPPYFATWVTWFVIFAMVLASFALTFAAGPDVNQAHRWVTPGSIFGAVIFLLTTYGFRLYVQNLAHYDLTYGSLGGVMMLMFWLYISSLVLLVAGEVNKVCYKAREWSGGCAAAAVNTSDFQANQDPVLNLKGVDMTANWNFCPSCGTKLPAPQTPTTPRTCTQCGRAASPPDPKNDVDANGDSDKNRPWEPIGPTGFGC
jgi:membrane protein